MPARRARLHAAALLGYVSVAALFAWPLPMHLGTALLGAPGGDTGVYVWNLWVFRHEIVSHGAFPFFTTEILHATPPVPLTLHNYTTVANIVAFPVLPLLGTVATFNLLVLASAVLSAYVMFLLLRQQVGDPAAAWIGGVLFGFSPFMMARQAAHFSLVQAGALPACALLLHRIAAIGPTRRRSVALGAVMAWAYLSDPYYAVYCLLMALFFVGWQAFTVERVHRAPAALRRAADLALGLSAAVVVAILWHGGRRIDIGAIQISVRGMHTPVLVLTALTVVRGTIACWPRISWRWAPVARFVPVAVVAGLTSLALLAPVLIAMAGHLAHDGWISPPVFWRSSPPGVDLLALVAPNPMASLTAWMAAPWLSRMPDGLYENVASIPWTAILVVAAAMSAAGLRVPRYWAAFTAAAVLLALGPFITVGSWTTYIPAPWALVRYLPVLGAARMPTRMTVLVMLGVAVVLAHAVQAIRARSARPWVPAAVIAGLLLGELAPAPRTLHEVRVPRFYELIARDPRPVSVMHLPFGLRDGLTSAGDFSARAQFLQTFHEKPLIGGYLSRLPQQEVLRYRRIPLMDVLLDLSEGLTVEQARLDWALRQAYGDSPALGIGYVIVDTSRASAELVAFARAALDLQHLQTEGDQTVYIVR